MMKPLDERLSLPVEQGVLLWAMRVWVAGQQHDADATSRIADMFGRLGVPEAAPFFEGFMFALSHGATRRITVQCPCQKRLTEDERALLDSFGLAQEHRPFEALLLLRGMATSEASRSALCSAERFGTAMAAAGRTIPAPDSAVARFAFALPVPSAAPSAAPEGVTLH